MTDPAKPRPPSPQAELLEEAIAEHRRRHARGQTEGRESIGRNLAMIGALGWMIVTPTLLGVFAGRWLDRHLPMQSAIFWTLGLMLVGLAIGCRLAWKRMLNK